MIKHTAINNSGLSYLDEPIIKEGLKKYLRRDINSLEDGLRIIHREKGIDKRNIPDFVGTDKNGNQVLIECKGVANEYSVEQIIRYRKAQGKTDTRDSRCVLIAFKILPECLRIAESANIELYETDLKFTKIP